MTLKVDLMRNFNLKGKRVLIREDLNVPVKDGRVSSDARIRAALPTIQAALAAGARVILMSHLGRPVEGQFDAQFSMAPVATHLAGLLGKPVTLIRFFDDRPGHDRRYSLDASKLARLGFSPATPFDDGLTETVRWYRDHEEWWRPIKERDAAYREFYRSQYAQRLATSSSTAKEPG